MKKRCFLPNFAPQKNQYTHESASIVYSYFYLQSRRYLV